MAAVVAELDACSTALAGYLSAFPASHLDRFERAEPVWAPYYSIREADRACRTISCFGPK
eukprot:639586-Prymnesium_polylepis.2